MMIILKMIILLSLFKEGISQKAFMLTSSVGYYNYRQLSNVLEVYHILKELGFED